MVGERWVRQRRLVRWWREGRGGWLLISYLRGIEGRLEDLDFVRDEAVLNPAVPWSFVEPVVTRRRFFIAPRFETACLHDMRRRA
jgi:hypothetical protein